MIFLTKNKKESLPYNYYFIPTLLLTIAGIINTAYLAFSHFRNYTDITYASFCAISKAVNCDTVSQSPWSIFFGIPVAIWGLVGYLLFLLFILFVRKQDDHNIEIWSILLFLSGTYSITAVFFGYVSAVKIHSYCILCILSYTISFSLLLYCWITWRRFSIEPFISAIRRSMSLIASNIVLRSGLILLCLIFLSLKLLV